MDKYFKSSILIVLFALSSGFQYYYYEFICIGSYRSCYKEMGVLFVFTIIAFIVIYAFWVKNYKPYKKTEEEEMRDEINSLKRKLNKIEEKENLKKELKDLKTRLDEKKKK